MIEPLIVYRTRHEGMSAIVLTGEDPLSMIGPGMFIEDARMPEPNAAGLWAWVDEGSEPPEDGDDDATWRGHWRRLEREETQRLAAGTVQA